MCIYVGVLVHRWKWCCLVRCQRTSPGRCHINIFGRTPPPCAAPPAWRHPTGFAGVSYATVSGLVVGWLVVVEVVDMGVVECVGHTSVRRRGCDCWPRCGSSCWPSSVLMAWASLVFEVVGVVAGRGLGGHVSCPRPPCLASPYRLRRSVPRHCLGAGCGVVDVLPAGGRLRCR